MSRRYKKRIRVPSLVQEKRDSKKNQTRSQQSKTEARPNLQRILDGSAQIQPENFLQLQSAVGNKIARNLLADGGQNRSTLRAHSNNIVQRGGTLKLGQIGPRSKKPPPPPARQAGRPTAQQPWQRFNRPLPPGRFKRRGHTEQTKETSQEVDQKVKSLSKNKIGGSELISASAFEEQAKLKIFGRKSFLGFKRKGKSDKFFEGVTGKLRQYEGPLQGKGLEVKIFHLKSLVDELHDWLTKRGKKSSRVSIVEALIAQLTTEVDRLYIVELEKGLKEYDGLTAIQPRDKAQFLQNLLFRVKGRTTMNDAHSAYIKHYFKSKNKLKVELLERSIDDKIDEQLWEASETKGWFTGASEFESMEGYAGGMLNKLDWIAYKVELQKVGNKFQKAKKKTEDLDAWEGLFKKKSYYDPSRQYHKGAKYNMPVMQPGHHRRTLAMFKLDQLLGTDVIPPTFMAKHKGKLGTVMEEVESKSSGETTNPVVKKTLSKLYLLDVIAGQVDRHSGNWLIEVKGGVVQGVKGIDLDLAFGEGYTGKTVEYWNTLLAKGEYGTAGLRKGAIAGAMPVELKEIDQKLAQTIHRLAGKDKNKVRETLKGYINDTEIDATLDRLKALAKFLEPMLQVEDGHAISKI